MKIVFVLGSLQNQRSIIRVRSFIQRGVEVGVYAFNRSSDVFNSEVGFPIEIIGSFPNDLPYLKRIPLMLKSMGKVSSADADLYYLFGLDVALMFRLRFHNRPYVYEECDLVHTYWSNPFARGWMKLVDKRLIVNSRRTVLTSEGFLRYHFGNRCPDNVSVVPNRLDPSVVDYPSVPKITHDNLRIGFVGRIRFKTILAFVDRFCAHFPQHEFHFYGDFPSERDSQLFEPLTRLSNCHFHGPYKTPRDLPAIYAGLDWVLAAYDTDYENVRYAEPNKLYEAIYFETPIIVSKGTFLAERVEQWGVGLTVDASDETQVVALVNGLSDELTQEKIDRIRAIPKCSVMDHPNEWVDLVLSL